MVPCAAYDHHVTGVGQIDDYVLRRLQEMLILQLVGVADGLRYRIRVVLTQQDTKSGSKIGVATSAGGSGKGWATGDTDGDGDVDTSDLTTAIINFTGARMSGALGTTSNSIDRSFVLPALKRSDSDTSADISTARAEVVTQSPTDDDRVADPNKSQTGDLPRPIDNGQSTRPNSKRRLDGVLAEEIDWLS